MIQPDPIYQANMRTQSIRLPPIERPDMRLVDIDYVSGA